MFKNLSFVLWVFLYPFVLYIQKPSFLFPILTDGSKGIEPLFVAHLLLVVWAVWVGAGILFSSARVHFRPFFKIEI